MKSANVRMARQCQEFVRQRLCGADNEEKDEVRKGTPRWPYTEANLYHRVIDVGTNLTGFQNPPLFKGVWAPSRKFSSLLNDIG